MNHIVKYCCSLLVSLLGAWTASCLQCKTADAAFVVYLDKDSFLSTTGATDATGPLPDSNFIGNIGGAAPGPSTTVGSISYQAVRYRFFDFSDRFGGNELAISFGADGIAHESLNIVAESKVTAMGFDFVEPENDPFVNAAFADSTFTVSVNDADSTLFTFTFNAPNDAAAFVGVAGDEDFDSLEIRETTGGDENEFYGRVYTRVSAVPEPSSLALIGICVLFGLGRTKRRGHSKIRSTTIRLASGSSD